ncbi:MAG: septum formation initiator family protein [Algoriphagus sp.]|uniref:FtsB family cell division protein n=1 Tax=Algoriphagus sp. TaxID=1872435 RepID=UPI00181DBA69|nr:septum formation initiator family protein [Algoriphagus sp.]NVJ87752.1 septum formation initiator family protein [Algoriphagus sp.]
MKKFFKISTNFYVLAGSFFLFWMIFIDSNNLVNQFKLSRKLHELEDRKAFFQERKAKIKEEREELMNNPELMEKFAREKYFMKKETEDLYVIVKK